MNKSPALGVHRGTHEQLVPFHDCDPLGIVWHGHYYKYLEIAREDLFRKFRLDVDDFRALGLRLLMIETRCRYAFPMRFGEKLWRCTRHDSTNVPFTLSLHVNAPTQAGV